MSQDEMGLKVKKKKKNGDQAVASERTGGLEGG